MSSSKKKDVALACYAMVSGMFAMITHVCHCTDRMEKYAKQCGPEISARLVSRMKE
jgi:hypothetical protein